jgi:FKBP-type peptidyl-prolyl cis-trans isomerase 2
MASEVTAICDRGKEDNMSKAKIGDTVIVHYMAKLGDGTALTGPSTGRRLKFTLGAGEAIEDLERTVVGMKPGEARLTTVRGEKLFGQHRKQKIIEIDRQKVDDFKLEVGKRIRVPGQRFSVKVLDFNDSKVMVDTNHPLADRNLIFSIELVDIV